MNQPTPASSASQEIPPLKLKAEDPKDLPVISAFLQDALIPLIGMHYDTTDRSFSFFGHRFRWEKNPEQHEGQNLYERIQSFLHFHHVKEVKTQGIPETKNPNETLNLLSVTSEDPKHILLTFSGGKKVQLTVDQISAHLHDSDTSWPTPAKPHHDI